MKIKVILPPLLLTIFIVFSFLYTLDLEQLNSEEVFLTLEGKKDYHQYLEEHNIKSVVIAKFNQPQILQDQEILIKQRENLVAPCEENDCQFILPVDFPVSQKQLIPLRNETAFAGILIDENHGQEIKGMMTRLQQESFWQHNHQRIQFAGVPYTNLKLDEYSRSIKEILFPLFFAMSFLLIYFLFQNIALSLFLFLPSLASALLSQSFIKAFYSHSNLILTIVPLMMFILNLSLLFHVFYTAFETRNFKLAISEKKQPIALMLFSTFIGLISLYSSDLSIIRDFGLLSSMLLIVSSGISLLWTYSLENVYPLSQRQFRPRSLPVFSLTRPFNRKSIIIFSSLIFICGSFLFNRIHILTDANEYFPADDAVSTDMQEISKSFVGSPLVDIIFQTKDYNDIKELDLLEQKLLAEFEMENKNEIKLISSSKIVRFANSIYAKSEALPENQFAFQALLSQAPGGLGQAYSNLRQYRMTLFGNSMNVDQYEHLLNRVRMKADQTTQLPYSFNGIYYQLMVSQKEMIFTLFKSFLGTLIVISLVVLVLFRNLKLFGIIFLVNIIPVFSTFCFFFLLGISFNIATVMTFSISLGIIVDSTFHQLHALTQPEIIAEDYRLKVVQPIILSALTLSACFLMFAFNPFLPIRHFGISLCFVILVGALFDLKVLPPLIRKNFASDLSENKGSI